MRDALKRCLGARGVLAAVFLLILLLPAHSSAELYRWMDDDGVLHITDDLGKVPEEERAGMRVFESSPPKKAAVPEALVPAGAPGDIRMADELYGDHTLVWWANTFKKKMTEIREIEAGIYGKRQFMKVFEGGRRFGQLYGEEEVEKYEKLKQEVPDDESTLEGLKKELDELRRKAAIYGVPREVRGE